MTGDEAETDRVLQALANEGRRRMLDIVSASPGLTVGALAAEFDVTRVAVMKHLATLEAAGLIVSEKSGRSRRLYFNAAPIRLLYDRWTDEYARHWSGFAARLKKSAEHAHEKSKQDEG